MAEEKKEEESKQEEKKEEVIQPEVTDTNAVDDDRLDQIMEAVNELRETKPEPTRESPTGQITSWDQVSDQDLEYVVTHQSEYPQHVGAAFKEIRKRDANKIKSELASELGYQSFVDSNPEIFDPKSPTGKEIAKIMQQGRSQKDIMRDVVELAKYRTGAVDNEKKGRKKVVDALKSDGAHTPGSETVTEPPAPSFMDMPKEDFENQVAKVKLKAFNK